MQDTTFKLSNKVRDKSLTALSVYNVGRQKCTRSYEWGPGIRDHYVIHYVSAGKGTYRTGGVTRTLSAGDIFLIYPDTEVHYQADHSDPWSYEWVGFAGADAGPILKATDFTPLEPVLYAPAFGGEIMAALRRINEDFGNSFSRAVSMTGNLYGLLSILVRERTGGEDREDRDAELVRRIIAYIDQWYSYPISVEDMASYAGVSRSTLFRVFTRHLGCSPKEYLERCRIRRASYLLRSTQLTIGAISVSVGYDNGLYFSRAYKKLTGLSPSQYRRESSAEPGGERGPSEEGDGGRPE